jgi:hypothetical protein
MPSERDESEAAVQLPWEVADDAAPVVAEAPREDDRASDVLDYAVVEDRSVGAGDDVEAVDYEHPVPAEPVEEDLGPPPRGGGWTIATLCVGIGLIACCVLIPQADANRRLVYEREKLKVDLDSIKKQVATNDEFLRRVGDDPNLAERLAQRQMKIIREGTRVLELKKAGGAAAKTAAAEDVSPFHLVAVAPPPPMPPYEPRGGRLASLCYHPHRRLYLMGTGLFLMAIGLVCGFAPKGSS